MADIRLEIEYGGYSIQWVDYLRGFRLLVGEVAVKDSIKTLEDCRSWIDQKNKQKFKRIAVLHGFNWENERTPGEATSVIDSEHVWVTSGKERNKAQIKDVWLDTPGNRKALELIKTKAEREAEISMMLAGGGKQP